MKITDIFSRTKKASEPGQFPAHIVPPTYERKLVFTDEGTDSEGKPILNRFPEGTTSNFPEDYGEDISGTVRSVGETRGRQLTPGVVRPLARLDHTNCNCGPKLIEAADKDGISDPDIETLRKMVGRMDGASEDAKITYNSSIARVLHKIITRGEPDSSSDSMYDSSSRNLEILNGLSWNNRHPDENFALMHHFNEHMLSGDLSPAHFGILPGELGQTYIDSTNDSASLLRRVVNTFNRNPSDQRNCAACSQHVDEINLARERYIAQRGDQAQDAGESRSVAEMMASNELSDAMDDFRRGKRRNAKDGTRALVLKQQGLLDSFKTHLEREHGPIAAGKITYETTDPSNFIPVTLAKENPGLAGDPRFFRVRELLQRGKLPGASRVFTPDRRKLSDAWQGVISRMGVGHAERFSQSLNTTPQELAAIPGANETESSMGNNIDRLIQYVKEKAPELHGKLIETVPRYSKNDQGGLYYSGDRYRIHAGSYVIDYIPGEKKINSRGTVTQTRAGKFSISPADRRVVSDRSPLEQMPRVTDKDLFLFANAGYNLRELRTQRVKNDTDRAMLPCTSTQDSEGNFVAVNRSFTDGDATPCTEHAHHEFNDDGDITEVSRVTKPEEHFKNAEHFREAWQGMLAKVFPSLSPHAAVRELGSQYKRLKEKHESEGLREPVAALLDRGELLDQESPASLVQSYNKDNWYPELEPRTEPDVPSEIVEPRKRFSPSTQYEMTPTMPGNDAYSKSMIGDQGVLFRERTQTPTGETGYAIYPSPKEQPSSGQEATRREVPISQPRLFTTDPRDRDKFITFNSERGGYPLLNEDNLPGSAPTNNEEDYPSL